MVMKIEDSLRVQRRFLRSAHLERDFNDPSSLEGYVITRSIQEHVDRVSAGLDPRSGQRAWRITGDYGCGKSSFALLLANLLAGRDSELPVQIRRAVDLTSVHAAQRPLLPVLITGSREPLAAAVVRALEQSLSLQIDKRAQLRSLAKIQQALKTHGAKISDAHAIALIQEANSELIAKERRTGMLIVIDELGKFLEFSALHPERQDIFFLQQLAEVSARSGKQALLTVGLLHQGFDAYADTLSQNMQREWEKVAGRFENVIFNQSPDEIVRLVGTALGTREDARPRGWTTRARDAMRSTVALGWFGLDAPVSALAADAPNAYPLHPTTIPVLSGVLRRFGQNERSMFSFLLSNEPFGLRSFANKEVALSNCFRLHDLYDYTAANFGHRLGTQSYRNHWNHIDSLIRSFPARSEMELKVLKTVGLLNLLNSHEVVPTEDALVIALSDGSPEVSAEIAKTIRHLHVEKHVLFSRGRTGGYCLWPHTSVDLYSAYEESSRVVEMATRVSVAVQKRLTPRPIVARRHYIQTGSLRHFEVMYCSILHLEKAATNDAVAADGKIVIPLCETAAERDIAVQFAESAELGPATIIGIPEPLGALAGLLHEVERWSWIQNNTPELKDDRFAAEEVARQVTTAEQALDRRVQHYVGLKNAAHSSEPTGMRWFHEKLELKVRSSGDLVSFLSDLCEILYYDAPIVQNELVNRRSLSSAAAGARSRVIEGMLLKGDQQFLGMDSEKRPPEMSIYLSLLLEGRVHRKQRDRWTIGRPSNGDDPCHLVPILEQIVSILEEDPAARVPVDKLFEALRRQPFGARDGILPILLVIVLIEHQHEIALFEDGTFLSHVGPEEILRLTKAPQTFALQFCRIAGIRLHLFDRLIELLGVEKAPGRTEVLDVVRPVCVFVAELPQYSRTTKNLSPDAAAVRHAVLTAREPTTLLFKDLPRALGFEAFSDLHNTPEETHRSTRFVARLKEVLNELKMVYAALSTRIKESIEAAFVLENADRTEGELRKILRSRAEPIIIHLVDPDLKAFCLRLTDNHLSDPDWIESIGSYVAVNPPSRWKDQDELVFKDKLQTLVRKFRSVESVYFETSGEDATLGAYRVSLTQRDGSERQRVIHLGPHDEKAIAGLEHLFAPAIKKNRTAAMCALSRMMWQLMEEEDEPAGR